MATLAVGDIHGNLAALDDLLAQVVPELLPDDELVFLGDYIDDGPDVPRCVDRIVDLREHGPCAVVALMGNHEQWMLHSYRDPTRHSWILGMAGLNTVASYSPDIAAEIRQEIDAVGPRIVLETVSINYGRFFDALPPRHLDFFANLKLFHRSPAILCVHGGYDPRPGPIEAQPAESLIWGPDDFPDGYQGHELVVYGHHNNAILDSGGWPHARTGNGTFGIDTIRHGVLTAMRFLDQRVFQSSRFLLE